MHDSAINEHSRLATLERIANYTVGIAVHENRGIGTGTFVTDGTGHYILTAAHVIDGADVTAARFFIRPNEALIEKPAIDTRATRSDRPQSGLPSRLLTLREIQIWMW